MLQEADHGVRQAKNVFNFNFVAPCATLHPKQKEARSREEARPASRLRGPRLLGAAGDRARLRAVAPADQGRPPLLLQVYLTIGFP